MSRLHWNVKKRFFRRKLINLEKKWKRRPNGKLQNATGKMEIGNYTESCNRILFLFIFVGILRSVAKRYHPFQCVSLLTMGDINFFHYTFHKTPCSSTQDNFILKLCSVSNVKRPRKRQVKIHVGEAPC